MYQCQKKIKLVYDARCCQHMYNSTSESLIESPSLRTRHNYCRQHDNATRRQWQLQEWKNVLCNFLIKPSITNSRFLQLPL